MTGIEDVLRNIGESAIAKIPNLLGALIILVIGFIVGKLMGRIIRELLSKMKVDEFLSEEKYLNIKPSSLGDVITRWVIYLVAIQAATSQDVLGIEPISRFVASVYSFVIGVVGAAIIILVGYGIAVYIKDKIITSRTIYSDITGKIVFALILVIAITMGLGVIPQMKVNILEDIIKIIVASIGIGMAIAIGLGLKDVIAELAREWVRKESLIREPRERRRRK